MEVLTNREIAERYNAMPSPDENEKLEVLSQATEISKDTLKIIIENENRKMFEQKLEEKSEVKAADVSDLKTFVPGTAIYKLIEERLATLDTIIKNATKEYKELAGFINGR